MKTLHLSGSASVPPGALGVVLVVHSGPASRAQAIRLADLLHHSGLASLVVDIRAVDEGEAGVTVEAERIAHRFGVGLEWIAADPRTRGLPVGGLADSMCASGLLLACAHHRSELSAAACIGGNPHLAGDALESVAAPILLVVGENDLDSLSAARTAQRNLGVSELAVINDTRSVVDEPEAFFAAAYRIRDWFVDHLATEAH
jgi:putative phosphoribosyl transferase